MEYLTLIILVGLVTYRLTKFINEDRLIRDIRESVQMWCETRWIAKQPEHLREGYQDSEKWNSLGAYWLSCPWCVSIWVGGAVTLATAMFTSVPMPIMVWLASSAITGFMSSREGGD